MEEHFVSYECYDDIDNNYLEFLECRLMMYPGFHQKEIDEIECLMLDVVYYGREIFEGIIIGVDDRYTADKLHEEYFRMNGWTIADENKLYE